MEKMIDIAIGVVLIFYSLFLFFTGYTIGRARLKADMVAMLEDIRKDIIELPFPQREPEYMQGYSFCQMNILDYVIQEKISKLREMENEKR